MQQGKLLQNIILKACITHKKRLEVVMVAADSLVKRCRLSVVGLGRGLINGVKTKHNINRMDRLVGNPQLYQESLDFYRITAQLILSGKVRPGICVDWSSATVAERYQVLRAAVAVGGRTLTIYEEIHPLKKYNNPKVHAGFLKKLQQVLPAECKPIIVTDAGFSIPWFEQVASYGWDFVGRVINKSYYKEVGEEWVSIPSLLKYGKSVIKRLGRVILTKQHQFSCYLQVHKSKPKRRSRKNVYGEKSSRSVSIKSAKRERQPWILAHSLGGSRLIAEKVSKIYATRMQIEESFRDIKNPQFGFSLRYCRSSGIKRLTNLFLIGLIGTLIAWMTGLCAKNRSMHYGLQTNSIKHRNVLSTFFIGCEMMGRQKFKKDELLNAIEQIKEHIYVW